MMTFMRPRRSAVALLAGTALLATACGARLEPEVRDQAVAAQLSGGGTGTVTTTDGGGVAAGAGSGTTTTDGGTTTTAGDGGSTTTAGDGGTTTTAGDGGSTTTSGGGGTTTTAGDGGTTTTGGGGGAASGTDTRSAPAGGNGGATDTGVFEDRIVIGNAADITGPVPGIFVDAQLAVKAFVQYFTATEGTIYGRQLVLDPRDSQLDANRNREHYLDFCETAFAVVGSMSAVDEGIIQPVRDCGIPDIRSAVTNPSTMEVPSVYGSDAISSTLYPMNQFHFWDEANPGIKEKAGLIYIDNDTTEKQTRLVKTSTEKIGYNWVVDRKVSLAETNYSSHALALKEADAQFVFFQGDSPQATRLAKAMRQQGYFPTVYALQQNLYKPSLIQQGGADIEGAELALGTVMVENLDQHPELQTYREWLKRIDANAEPTGQGMYSWGASLILVNALKAMGPQVTRAKLIDYLNSVKDFDGNGLYPPQDVGGKIPANCHIIARVEGGKFVPLDPPGGTSFSCRGQNQQGSING